MTSYQTPGPEFIDRRRSVSVSSTTTKRTQRFSLLLALLLASILGYLLVSNYRNLIALQTNRIDKLFFDVEEKTKIIAYFFSERENDLHYLAAIGGAINSYFTNQKLGMTEEYGLKASRALVTKKFAELNRTLLLGMAETYSRLALFSTEGKVVVDFKGTSSLSERWSDDISDLVGNHPEDFQVRLIGTDRQYVRLVVPVGNPPHHDGYIAGWIAADALDSAFLNTERLDRQHPATSSEYYILRIDDRFAVFADGYPASSGNLKIALASGHEFALPAIGDTQAGWKEVETDFFGNAQTIVIFSSLQRNATLQLVRLPGQELLTETAFPLLLTSLLALLSVVVLGFSFMAYQFFLRTRIFNLKLQDAAQRQKEILEINTALREEMQAREDAELRVQEQRQRLDMVFKAINAGLWDWSVQSGEFYIDERWAEIAGYSLAELSPVNINTWLDLMHQEDLQRSNSLLEKHFNKETVFYICQVRIRHKSGHWVWVSNRGQVVQWSEDGMPLRMTGIRLDITETKKTEQRLAASETNFRALFDTLGDMIFVSDAQGRIIIANRAVRQKLQYRDIDLQDMTILDLHSAEHRCEAEEILAAMLKRERETCSLPLVTNAGAAVPVESRIWFGQWNGLEAIFCISKDLSPEQEAQHRFERLFRNNPVAMAIFSAEESLFLDVNTTFLKSLGYGRNEVIGRSAKQLGLFLEPDMIERALYDLLTTASFTGLETQVRCKNGEIIDGIFSGELLKTQQGNAFLTVMVNITAIKTAERGLRQTNDTLELRVRERTRLIEQMHEKMIMHDKMAAVGQLATGVAHELNNPINFVATNFNVLKEYYTDFVEVLEKYRNCIDKDNPAMQAHLRAIEADFHFDFILKDIPNLFDESERGFERIEKIIRSMRNFSHTDQTGIKVSYDINAAIQDTLIIAINAYKYHAEVTTDLGLIPPALCLPELLKQVFLNLLINSAQAIEMQKRKGLGRITIRTRQDDGDLVCEFADDGPSIPKKLQARIFEPFFTTKPPGTGVGLGLSICYDIIVNKHQGELSVACPKNGGTVFTLRLPIGRKD